MPRTPPDDTAPTEFVPRQIGRYKILKQIGEGGFGKVYLATDDQLRRQVAIKVPHRNLLESGLSSETYLDEARMVANLDHPNIVSVYDVGSDENYSCFIVSKYIQGHNLREALRGKRFRYTDSAELVATIAEALHYAHKQGLVHRDVKPSNILIDSDGRAFIADFGLALPERPTTNSPAYAGTPAYMSPEQARGEGHRVDGRSDIFSLGIVLYELLAGRRPFQGDTTFDLLDQVEHFEPKPLRQFDESLPRELDRICQRAIAKKASDRYWTAHDLSDDLRVFLAPVERGDSTHRHSDTDGRDGRPGSRVSGSPTPPPGPDESATPGSHVVTKHSVDAPTDSSQQLTVIPKGLHSFDSHDADFFLQLLPGPCDRNGLPESLRFWKQRIEATDHDETFPIGMIAGPSGCGKSSFVKAGLLPRLSRHVVPVFVEASADATEKRLHHGLLKVCPGLDERGSLHDFIGGIRRGDGVPPGRKILIVFDQFEQWLHANRVDKQSDLIRALRQCDGERVQAILMVRSDFWMAVTRLLTELEVELVQGKNFAPLDLFPQRHAEKVLTAFGRAFGTLPETGAMSESQAEFIAQSVAGLMQDGKVICVRLAVYAEMMKHKPWNLETLKAVGGTEGVGVTFLDESFGPQANPKIRLHQLAARSVLKALLPDPGVNINDRFLSYQELLAASGYAQPEPFDQLIKLLDGEMRLISPTDPAGVLYDRDQVEQTVTHDPEQRYFRLTHDYLISALRQWLSRKQRETRRGRAELLLEERAGFWKSRRERRYLPNLFEYVRIRAFTNRSQWDQAETQMMRSASRSHGTTLAVSILLGASLLGAGYAIRHRVLTNQQAVLAKQREQQRNVEARRLVDALLKAETNRVQDILVELPAYRSLADPLLVDAYQTSSDGSSEKLHVALAMLRTDDAYQDYVIGQLPNVPARKFAAVCRHLTLHRDDLPESFVRTFADLQVPAKNRLQAACAIAQFDTQHATWSDTEHCRFIAEQMTQLYPSDLAPLRAALRPVANALIPSLRQLFQDAEHTAEQRLYAAETLVDYQIDQPTALFQLLLDCDSVSFPLVLESLAPHTELVIDLANQQLSRSIHDSDDEAERERVAQHQANAAVARYMLGDGAGLLEPVLDDRDPRVGTYVVHRLASHGASVKQLAAEHLAFKDKPVDTNRLMANHFALGEFGRSAFDNKTLQELIRQTIDRMKATKSAGVWASGQWLLQALGEGALVTEASEALMQRDLREHKVRLTNLEQLEQTLARKQAQYAAERETWTSEVLSQLNGSESNHADATSSDVRIPLEELSAFTLRSDLPQDAVSIASSPIGDVVRFDGKHSGPLVGQDDFPVLSNAFSLACWFRSEGSDQYASLVSKMDADDHLRGIDLWYENGRVATHIKNRWIGDDVDQNRWIKVISTDLIDDGKWHHLMATHDGSGKAAGVRLHVDGDEIPVNVISDNLEGPFTNATPWLIAGRESGMNFRGSLGRFLLTDHQMTSDQVRLEYYRGLAGLLEADFTDLQPSQQELVSRAANAESDAPDSNSEVTNHLVENYVRSRRDRERSWFYGAQGQPFVRIHADQFVMGARTSDPAYDKDEKQHERTIARVYAMASTEVTLGRWAEFIANANITDFTRDRFPPPDPADIHHPVNGVTWFEAAQYCNWLSQQEGLPESQWCFKPNTVDQYKPMMKLKPDCLELCGYRLPTQAEWEFACRGGTVTTRHFGRSESILPEYAYFQQNSNDQTWPIARLKPNPLGLFDMNGNVQEWCLDLHSEYPVGGAPASDWNLVTGIVDTSPRSIRGGAFYDMPQYITSAHRYSYGPDSFLATGFRVTQTLDDKRKSH